MQTSEDLGRGWFLWSVALEIAFAGIMASFILVALGYLNPALALPLIGLVIIGALARLVLLRNPRGSPPSQSTDGSPASAQGSE